MVSCLWDIYSHSKVVKQSNTISAGLLQTRGPVLGEAAGKGTIHPWCLEIYLGSFKMKGHGTRCREDGSEKGFRP